MLAARSFLRARFVHGGSLASDVTNRTEVVVHVQYTYSTLRVRRYSTTRIVHVQYTTLHVRVQYVYCTRDNLLRRYVAFVCVDLIYVYCTVRVLYVYVYVRARVVVYVYKNVKDTKCTVHKNSQLYHIRAKHVNISEQPSVKERPGVAEKTREASLGVLRRHHPRGSSSIRRGGKVASVNEAGIRTRTRTSVLPHCA